MTNLFAAKRCELCILKGLDGAYSLCSIPLGVIYVLDLIFKEIIGRSPGTSVIREERGQPVEHHCYIVSTSMCIRSRESRDVFRVFRHAAGILEASSITTRWPLSFLRSELCTYATNQLKI